MVDIPVYLGEGGDRQLVGLGELKDGILTVELSTEAGRAFHGALAQDTLRHISIGVHD